MSFEDDEQGGLDEREMPDESDMDGEEETPGVACPYCGKFVYEEAEVCPHCGSYIVREEGGRRRLGLRWGLVLLVVGAIVLGICGMRGLL
ncbi:MAG: zinc ribbon domain-containing protein [Bacillota bacterium]